MLINGEKFACEACVRGHRVSSCTHQDRKLLHVNKKGRPVSQCPHCRSLRKNRSAHSKCECHDKSHAKEDCPHLKDSSEGQTNSPPNTCCCGHGARCTCSLKKEAYLDTVPEDISQVLLDRQREAQKHLRGPNANQHESKPTVFTNGHHKPVHKFNDAHNHCGAPYRVPSRSNSHLGHREIAQRSTDSLPLPARAIVHHESPLHAVTTLSQSLRQARSEHNSPMLGPTSNPTTLPPFQLEIPPLSPNAYSYSPFDAQSPGLTGAPHLPDNIPDNWFVSHDDAHANGPPNVPELAYIDWSKYGFSGTPTNLDSNDMKSIYGLNSGNGLGNTNIPPYATSLEHLNQLHSGFNTSSGDLSEVEELHSNYRPSNFRTVSHNTNDTSSICATDENDSYRLSTNSSYFGTPIGNALASNMEDLDIDKFIIEQKNKQQQQQQQMHNHMFAAHPQSQTPELQQGSLPVHPVQAQHANMIGNSLQQQPTPPQSQHTMSTPPESIRGFSIASQPSPDDSTSTNANPTFDPHMSYSIKEAQAYAHMQQNNAINEMHKNNVQMMQTTAVYEDPMWGGAPYGDNREFGLDDEREDEQWAR